MDTVLLMEHRNELYTLNDIFNANATPFAPCAVARARHSSTVQFRTTTNIALLSPI